MKGNRIKQLREEKGLKQEELAKVLLVAPSTIGMYERDEREPNDSITLKIADFFGVSTDYLLGKTDIRQPITQVDFEKHLLNSKFAEKYNKLTDEQKKTLDSLVEVWEKENKKEKE